MAEYKQIVSTTFEDTEDKSSTASRDNMFGEKQSQDAVTVRFADTYQVR